MDIFKFHSPTTPTLLEQGEIINGITQKMWVERYDKAGEFKIVAPVVTGLRQILPIGSIISHVDTQEVMIVENHEISDQEGKEIEIIITGRGFETYFENRIVGSNKIDYDTNHIPSLFVLNANETWDQAVTLIKDHIYTSELIDDDNSLPNIEVTTDVTGTGVSAKRKMKKEDLYKSLLEILAIDKLGVKTIRPGPWSPLGGSDPDLLILIHKGTDRSAEVIFSYDTGEIEHAEYLWSNKKTKTAAVVTGKWLEIFVDTDSAKVNYSRRVMHINASDIDDIYSSTPTGTDLTEALADMEQRGLEALAEQVDVSMTKVEVSKEGVKAKYRTDFDVGDLITVQGDYNATTKMRVSEFVEIEDENGSLAYPTLTTVEES